MLTLAGTGLLPCALSMLLAKRMSTACSTMVEVGSSTSMLILTLPSNVIASTCGVTSIA